MPNTNINIRMDSDLKNQFEEFCSSVGLSMTAAINVFAKKVVAEQRARLADAKAALVKTNEAMARLKAL